MSQKKIPLAGVIGSPVAHSRSPRLHRYWLNALKIDGYYIPIDLTPDSFGAGLKSLPALGFKGVNITIPHKERALQLADDVTDRAALIGAANTLTFRKNGHIHADNTDGYGFIANLKHSAPNWRAADGVAVVFGAGGAARAVVSALLGEGAPRVVLVNRTRNRAEILRERFGNRVEVVDWGKTGDALATAATIVNTTALGMNGANDLALVGQNISAGALVTDLVYTPLETGFLRDAKKLGLQTVDGLGMLLHQGVPGFESWFRKKPSVDDDLRRHMVAP